MLGVLKRRWKPKRSSTPRINTNANVDSPIPDKGTRLVPSVRQVHPVHEEKHHPLCGDADSNSYMKRASLDSNTSPTQCWGAFDCDSNSLQCYPLAPNICVEAGRIQFIRNDSSDPMKNSIVPESPVLPKKLEARITVTRGLQTEETPDIFLEEKKLMEQRIGELEASFELAQKNEERDRLIIRKLQKQMAKRESAHRDAERERRLRIESESRAKRAVQEATRCKSRLKILTTEFTRMEETIKSMLVYKKQVEQLQQEKAVLTLAFENRCRQYQTTISKLNQEVDTLRHQLEQIGYGFNPDSKFDIHSVDFQKHVEKSRQQYERCLDDVANQVVKALVAQKGLREEVSTLNGKIKDLESQNKALRALKTPHSLEENIGCNLTCRQCALKEISTSDNSSISLVHSTPLKYSESSSSELFGDRYVDDLKTNEKLLGNAQILETKLSFDEKKRIWNEFKGVKVTPKKLVGALSAIDFALCVPPQRPMSLNLQLPIVSSSDSRKNISILAKSISSSEEKNGSESPESKNRDEGYSTMSSDVQADVTRASTEAPSVQNISRRSLEDLKEVTDENDNAGSRLLVADSRDPDILYIPFNLLKSRNSFPPARELLPFQHIMRSFSDSHLCIKITTAPSPCYTFTSPISSSPSIYFVDISDRKNVLRKNKTGTWGKNNTLDEKSSQIFLASTLDDRLDCNSWETEYIQHWLRLDETRSALQQHRDLFELEYDRTELEDWSLSLSNDDLREAWKKSDVTTPGQVSTSTLPSIQENNTLELEEDSNECLWNNSSYMMDKDGRELVTFLMDATQTQQGKSWPYALANSLHPRASPNSSWSSGESDCRLYEPDTYSKRSSAALSGCSDDTGEIPIIETDFTRDFYRLVKFESTKSLASTSSKSVQGETTDRDITLQNVLTFLNEQQKFVCPIDKESVTDFSKEITSPTDSSNCDNLQQNLQNFLKEENYVTLRQLCEEALLNEQNLKEQPQDKPEDNLINIKQNIAYAHEVCLVTPLDVESENCSNMCDIPADIREVNVAFTYDALKLDDESDIETQRATEPITDSSQSDLTKSSDTTCSDILLNSDSLTSSVSTPETVISKIPRRKSTPTKTQGSPSRTVYNNNETKIPKMKVQRKSPKHRPASNNTDKPSISTAGTVSNIIDGSPLRAVSFHERATSKDVIDELNRMIKYGEENVIVPEHAENKLDQSCKLTGWVHVEKSVDLSDPKARTKIFDVMMTAVSSDSSPTSSCGGSFTSETAEDPPDYGHLHRIHRVHRQKKANAIRPEMAVVKTSQAFPRPTIIGRTDFYVRYGEKEKEAVASFDFLDNLSTSSSVSCSLEEQLEEEQ